MRKKTMFLCKKVLEVFNWSKILLAPHDMLRVLSSPKWPLRVLVFVFFHLQKQEITTGVQTKIVCPLGSGYSAMRVFFLTKNTFKVCFLEIISDYFFFCLAASFDQCQFITKHYYCQKSVRCDVWISKDGQRDYQWSGINASVTNKIWQLYQ